MPFLLPKFELLTSGRVSTAKQESYSQLLPCRTTPRAGYTLVADAWCSDGSSMIIQNGEVLAQSSQFSLLPVEVTVAIVDLGRVRSYRTSHSRNVQAARQPEYPRVECDITLGRPSSAVFLSDEVITKEVPIKLLDPMEEIHLATSVYLWQYLVRSSSAGFFLALSGGLDSSTVALFVYGMCKLVFKSIRNGEESTLRDLRKVVGLKDYDPKSPEEIVSKLFHTCFMGTVNSSGETRSRTMFLGYIGGFKASRANGQLI